MDTRTNKPLYESPDDITSIYNPNASESIRRDISLVPRIEYDNGLPFPSRWQVLREHLQVGLGYDFYPFGTMIKPSYNINQIKKVYDIFPSSLRRAQLSSNELVEFLRSQIFDKDVTIDELRRQLAEISDFSESTLDNQLAALGFDNVNDLIQSLGFDFESGTNAAELQAKGYVQVGSTDLWILVDSNPTQKYPFELSHKDENGSEPFGAQDIISPTSVTFKNIGDVPLYFVKQEYWTGSEDPFGVIAERFDGNPYAPTNAFKFKSFPNSHNSSYSIQPKSEIRTTIELGYRYREDYKDAGLRRSGKTNTWTGDMRIYASKTGGGVSSLKRTGSEAFIGNMKIYRDRGK